MNHLDLFSGIGGFSLAAKWVWGEEYKNIGFVEIDRYCQELLKLRFPGARIYGDIKEVTKEHIIADTQGNGTQGGILKRHWESELGKDDVPIIADTKSTGSERNSGDVAEKKDEPKSKNDGAESERGNKFTVDLLTGGFPCQPFSQAGQRRGTQDDRHLWPEMLRIIDELRPRFVIGENVSGITNMAQHEGDPEMESEADNEEDCADDCGADGILWGIIDDLERIGYSVQTFVIPACAVNAPHRRDRVWIVAHSENLLGHGGYGDSGICPRPKEIPESGNSGGENTSSSQGCGEYDTDPAGFRPSGQGQQEPSVHPKKNTDGQTDKSLHGSQLNTRWDTNWIEAATCLCRMDDGLPYRMDGFELSQSKLRIERLKSLGNSIVPQVVYQIMLAIKQLDTSLRSQDHLT